MNPRKHDIWYGDKLTATVDLDAKTYTEFDEKGKVLATRPLTAAEIAAMDPPPAPPSLEERVAELERIVATLTPIKK